MSSGPHERRGETGFERVVNPTRSPRDDAPFVADSAAFQSGFCRGPRTLQCPSRSPEVPLVLATVWRRFAGRIGQAPLSVASQDYIHPHGRMNVLISDSKGRTYRIDDEKLLQDLTEIERELARREGRQPRREGLGVTDTRAHADLTAAKERAYDAAAVRYQNRPALQVKPGDWVRIGGYRFRIGHVDARSNLVETERLAPDGSVVSSVPADGAGLLPDTSSDPEPAGGLRPPATMRDGYDRARYVLKAHERALGDRWSD